MKRIFADRAMGKSSALLTYAMNLALANPTKQVVYVTSSQHAMDLRSRELTTETPNLVFKSYSYLHSGAELGREELVDIDEVDMYLLGLNVVGYTATIGDNNEDN